MPINSDVIAPLGNAELSHRRPAKLDRFWYGAVYYPEHWDAATRKDDAKRMRDAGITIVRMAEFAWDLMEPEEGRFDFSLFDDTIGHLGDHGISTIMCTPTATPPRWLTLKHPHLGRVDVNGVVQIHGTRQHACHMNPVFRQYSRAITQDMAAHWRASTHVVGWQTDNEINCHFSECHCASCQIAFQQFLRRKFAGDIGKLNADWGTAFWAQTYDRFEDIPTPRPEKPAYANPAHHLDYFRYLYDGVARFQHDQVEILRAQKPSWWITHNGIMSHVDYRGLFSQDLDVLGYDVYPMFHWEHTTRAAGQAFSCDRARANAGNFIVPEQQSGPGGQRPYFHDTPEPGELRSMTYTSIARGADSLLYFRWRTCRFGAEEYWCGIIDHDNVPRRRFDEVKRIGAELRAIGPEIMGTHVHVDAAVAGADIHVSDAHSTYHLGLPSDVDISWQVHKELFDAGYAVGCIHPSDDLAGVKLYVIPHWAVFDPAWVPNLTRFVERGGTLVIGARTATRDWNNNVVPDTLPGCLRALAGVTVEEYGKQNRPDLRPLTLQLPGGTELRSENWFEQLSCARGTEVFATWKERHLAGSCAISLRRVGTGHVVYVGTYLTTALAKALQPEFVRLAGLSKLWPDAPAAVQAVRREAVGKRLWFFLNHGEGEVTLASTPRGTDLTTGKSSGGPLTLPRHGVAVIKEASHELPGARKPKARK